MADKDDKSTSTLDHAPTTEVAPKPMGANGKGSEPLARPYYKAPPQRRKSFCHILAYLMNPGQTGSEMGGLITLIEYAK